MCLCVLCVRLYNTPNIVALHFRCILQVIKNEKHSIECDSPSNLLCSSVLDYLSLGERNLSMFICFRFEWPLRFNKTQLYYVWMCNREHFVRIQSRIVEKERRLLSAQTTQMVQISFQVKFHRKHVDRIVCWRRGVRRRYSVYSFSPLQSQSKDNRWFPQVAKKKCFSLKWGVLFALVFSSTPDQCRRRWRIRSNVNMSVCVCVVCV